MVRYLINSLNVGQESTVSETANTMLLFGNTFKWTTLDNKAQKALQFCQELQYSKLMINKMFSKILNQGRFCSLGQENELDFDEEFEFFLFNFFITTEKIELNKHLSPLNMFPHVRNIFGLNNKGFHFKRTWVKDDLPSLPLPLKEWLSFTSIEKH